MPNNHHQDESQETFRALVRRELSDLDSNIAKLYETLEKFAEESSKQHDNLFKKIDNITKYYNREISDIKEDLTPTKTKINMLMGIFITTAGGALVAFIVGLL